MEEMLRFPLMRCDNVPICDNTGVKGKGPNPTVIKLFGPQISSRKGPLKRRNE